MLLILVVSWTELAAEPPALSGQEMSLHEVISRTESALEGEESLRSIRSLRFTVGDGPGALRWEIILPSRVRKERDDGLVLVFDGERAGFLREPKDDGTVGGPRLVPQEDWHHFELDVALYLPAFLNHPGTHAGTESADGRVLHLVQVELPLGGQVVYGIDGETFLPAEIRLPEWDYHRVLGCYVEIDGILFPTCFWDLQSPDSVTSLHGLEWNVDLAPERFTLPEGLGVER